MLLKIPDSLKNQEKALNYIKMIHTAAKDAAEVVRHLREFYRLRDPAETFYPVHLNELIETVILLTRPMWKDQAQANGINIHVERDLQKVPHILGNESGLREVLTNLIFNAVEAMASDGQITLRTGCDDNAVVLEVIDTGIGMTEEACQLCFDPFFSTKGELGSGLGLSMVYGIIHRHDGEISVKSAQGIGTSFTVRLPFRPAQAASDKKEKAEIISPSLRVLVVEDELMVCEMIAQYLLIDGHTVETASNGREGLEKFKERCFDLVVTDRAMPEMNGDCMAAAIKQIAPAQPVIMLTGFGNLMEHPDEQSKSVDIIVGKPVKLGEFREAVATVMGK